MKIKKYFRRLIYIGAMAIFIMTQPGCEEVNGEGTPTDEIESPDTSGSLTFHCMQAGNFPHEELSQGEIEGLLFMREEEKLARDIYILFYDLFGQRNFSNISRSEQVHFNNVYIHHVKEDDVYLRHLTL